MQKNPVLTGATGFLMLDCRWQINFYTALRILLARMQPVQTRMVLCWPFGITTLHFCRLGYWKKRWCLLEKHTLLDLLRRFSHTSQTAAMGRESFILLYKVQVKLLNHQNVSMAIIRARNHCQATLLFQKRSEARFQTPFRCKFFVPCWFPCGKPFLKAQLFPVGIEIGPIARGSSLWNVFLLLMPLFIWSWEKRTVLRVRSM